MCSRPRVIGITTYARDEENRVHIPADYIDAVRRSGGVPILLPPGDEAIEHILDRIDGLILAGGGDIDPAVHGGASHNTVYMVDGERDKSELRLVQAAIERAMPTLAICRGAQIVNVVLGGTLHVHLPDVVEETVQHRAPPREPVPHEVTVDPQSLLSSILGRTVLCPMSWHHQAIDKVAPPLQVVARAADGVIEAVEHPDHPQLMAVQWHPELTAATDISQQRLFDALVHTS